ncbi:uncharacterized protein LOC144107751 [Amblyomma americanum]
MEEPSKVAEELSVAEASAAAPGTGVEPTASHGAGKHKKHAKKRGKSPKATITDTVKATDGGAESSPPKTKKSKRESKSKTDTAATTPRLESNPEPSSKYPAEALVETGAPAVASAEPSAPAAASANAPASAPADVVTQRPTEVTAYPQVHAAHTDHETNNSIPAIERRSPKPAILPMIGSVVIVFLLVAVVVGMMIARRKQIEDSKRSTVGGIDKTAVDISHDGTTPVMVSEPAVTTPVVVSDETAATSGGGSATSLSSDGVDAPTSR